MVEGQSRDLAAEGKKINIRDLDEIHYLKTGKLIEACVESICILKDGMLKKDVKAFACTSRGQAFRLGKAILFSEQQESEIVTLTTSIDAGAIVRPGSVIRINDPVRSGARRAGRIKMVDKIHHPLLPTS